jgi:hypothetical protein
MVLPPSKEMEDDYEVMEFEPSDWPDDGAEVGKADWLGDSAADSGDDDPSDWQDIRAEAVQEVVPSDWLRNCAGADEEIREWVDVDQCGGGEGESEKGEGYKSAPEAPLSTTTIEATIATTTTTITTEEDGCADYADHLENFDCLSVCSVEFFGSLSSLGEEE